ncbi:MAG: DUF2127 domain-containing protein [Kiritimatiellaeota bacterium]|nr:DUF2127 domain-containing protein [Kiritimatiellota bacterium]
MMTSTSRRQTLHMLFLISVWIKGLAGLLETLTGVICFFVKPETLMMLIISLTAPELTADRDDWFANLIVRLLDSISERTLLFAAAYLILHGVLKLLLVAGLLRGRLWVFPLSLVFLGTFIVYQVYRYTHTHALSLIFLTVMDLIVMFLVWREYAARKQNLSPALA